MLSGGDWGEGAGEKYSPAQAESEEIFKPFNFILQEIRHLGKDKSRSVTRFEFEKDSSSVEDGSRAGRLGAVRLDKRSRDQDKVDIKSQWGNIVFAMDKEEEQE